MQKFWICGASERAKLSRERERREPRKGRPEALSGHGKTTTIPQTVLRGTVIIYASLALPHTIEISPPCFSFLFFYFCFFSLNKNILGKICGILWIGEKIILIWLSKVSFHTKKKNYYFLINSF
jgi:hypothetical protein